MKKLLAFNRAFDDCLIFVNIDDIVSIGPWYTQDGEELTSLSIRNQDSDWQCTDLYKTTMKRFLKGDR